MLTETKSLSLQRDLVVDNVIDRRPYKSKQVLYSLVVAINHKIKFKNVLNNNNKKYLNNLAYKKFNKFEWTIEKSI